MRMSVACPQQKLHFDRTLYEEGPGRARGPKFCMQKKIGTGVGSGMSSYQVAADVIELFNASKF